MLEREFELDQTQQRSVVQHQSQTRSTVQQTSSEYDDDSRVPSMTHRHRFDDNRGPSMTRRHRFDSRGPPMSTNETSRPVSRRRQPQYREYGDFDSVPDLESIDWMSEKKMT